ncbi:ABC transporter ATP-binding protein [Chelativorans alearense]|uniref:ABC transporter ATP-binding protein n=1 Tax=Chelativorans alearense TaxID=2681495 RepID=UPI0013D75B14|nr:sn-glycerol-3-phosphate ABC transporter ATP-binding protein UgpC [Chelativorans alearense]
MAHVVVSQLFKKYGELQVVHGVDFEIGDGEFMVLVGPSGCGKSTILRMIAGLETVTGGEILVNDRVVNDIPPRDRDIAMVFQDYALYPHMSVRQNLGFGLKMRNAPRAEVEAAVRKTAETLQIEALLDRKPKQLSGGQRQRVAIGRAIAREPQLFLFDEPLSNLDAKLRVEMRTQIKRLHMSFKVTSIYVTHDQTEAMTLADRIVVLRDGRIEQVGTPEELYMRPANRFVAGFIGSPTMNFIEAQVVAEGDGLQVAPAGGPPLAIPRSRVERYRRHAGRSVILGIRPEDVTNTWTEESRDRESAVSLNVPVEIAEPLGSDTLIFARLGGAEIVCRASGTTAPASGSTIRLNAHMDRMHLFDPDSGMAL